MRDRSRGDTNVKNTRTLNPSTPTERGDGDYEGSASSLAHQNLPREKKQGQGRDKTTTTDGTKDRVRTRGVEDA
jgi:hypothetical protein